MGSHTTTNRATTAAFIFTALSFGALVWLESRADVSCGWSSQLEIQFAWHEQRVVEILACWGENGVNAVRQGMVADFFFVAAYAIALSLLWWRVALRLSVRPVWGKLAWIGQFAIWLAAFLDIAENLLILSVLNGATADPLALAIGLLATGKFALMFAAIVLLAAGSLACWRGHPETKRQPTGD